MTPEVVIDLMRQGIFLLLMMVSVIILPTLVVGLVISIFQAATQINEQSLSFVPRLIVTFVTLVVASPWLLQLIVEFTNTLFESIPSVIG